MLGLKQIHEPDLTHKMDFKSMSSSYLEFFLMLWENDGGKELSIMTEVTCHPNILAFFT